MLCKRWLPSLLECPSLSAHLNARASSLERFPLSLSSAHFLLLLALIVTRRFATRHSRATSMCCCHCWNAAPVPKKALFVVADTLCGRCCCRHRSQRQVLPHAQHCAPRSVDAAVQKLKDELYALTGVGGEPPGGACCCCSFCVVLAAVCGQVRAFRSQLSSLSGRASVQHKSMDR
jgi:hypothetical protein